ncbi:MAG: two-component system, LuxR family, sensor kinase FixL [Sphingomonadales bacterium]|nr:two-component system, LuxR family, sensor kinase FixL [Sphingomonadales bacterium]
MLPILTACLAIGIFILDVGTGADAVISMLYVGIVLLSARFLQKRGIVLVALACIALALVSYLIPERDVSAGTNASNLILSPALIGIAAFLAVQSRSREAVLSEQAGLLDLTHDTIFVRDMNDFITYWNRGAEELYGWGKAEAVGKTSHQLIQTIFPKPLEEIMAELLGTGRWEGELVHTKKDGARAIVGSRWSVRRDAWGRPAAILETNNDVTERNRGEEALREAQAQLSHVARVTTMGALTSSIAHEVNQPLAAIVANANAGLRWLAGDPPNVDEARATLENIVRDGHRSSEIIGRMRELLKKGTAATAPVDLNGVIEDTVPLVLGEVRRHGIRLRTDLARDLPPVPGDRVQLQQVMLNLMMNGIEAMREVADRPRELLIRSRLDESATPVIAVEDAGAGLDTQAMERVFEAFYTTKAEGMGMGLAICRLIIEAHGGRLWASANEPQGAAFQFTIPSAQEAIAPTGRADRKPAA